MGLKMKPRPDDQDKPFPIVAIGASAGGLPPLERFLSALPRKFGFALVFIQYLSPKHKNLLPELLRTRRKGLDIKEISDGLPILPCTLYLCPPAKEMRVRKGVFRVVSRSKKHLHLPIDEFLVSLSEDAPERTIAVIFSGAGTDGARGIQAVRTQGGTVFVQDPATAEYPDMPLAAINTGQMDGVLSPEDIAGEILRFHHSGMVGASADQFMTPAHFDSLERLVNERTGHHFSHYKRSVVLRRVRRRMYLHGISSAGDYLNMIAKNDQETAQLASDFLIGVTSFFRDRLAWRALHLEVTRKLIVQESNVPIRVWTAACATGEEAYSIAMLLQHELDLAGKKREIQVFATDVNDQALERAREGTYPASISADLPPDYLRSYLISTDDGLSVTVNKEIRQHVIFAKQDLLTDPPFSRLDLVICRNLLIYLEPDAQERCIALFHYALKKGGYLFLGGAESPGRDGTLFTARTHKKCRIYRKTDSKRALRMPVWIPFGAERSAPKPQPAPEQRQSITQFIQEALLEAHAPAAVAINRYHDILYHNGPTNRYLHQPRGAPTQNLLELLPDKLRNRMRVALYRAAGEGKPITLRTSVTVDERKKQLSILVSRLQDNLFLITFREKGSPAEEAEVSLDAAAIEETAVHQLENELAVTRDDLKSHNEQLNSLNEELESSNEELQAANEELETSREELQSLNEELTTVNSQLQTRIEDEEETNNDLNNFLASTSIPTIFLDLQFRVKRFTPAMARLITLIPGDVGRPIIDMALANLGPDLIADARSVLDNLTPLKRELPINDAWYVRTALPYRTSDNRIEGVVITYADVTELKRGEESLRQSESRYRELVQNANSAIIRWKADGTITFFNEYAQAFFGYGPAEVIGRSVTLLVPEKESTGGDLTNLIQNIVSHPEEYVNNINENVCRDGRRVWMAWTNKPIFDEHGRVTEVFAVGMDITERRRAEGRISHLASFPDLNLNPVLEVRPSGEVTYLNAAAQRILATAGLEETALLPEDMEAILSAWDGQTESTLYREVTIGDTVVEEAIQLVPQFNVARVYGEDITKRKEAEEAVAESRRRLAVIIDSIADGFFAMDREWRIIRVNDAALGYFGKTREQAVGCTFLEIFPEARGTSFEIECGRAMERGEPVHFEAPSIVSNKTMEVHVYPGPENVTVIFRDVTGRKAREHRIERLTRLYAVLSRVNEAIVRTRDEEPLFSEVCRIVADVGDFPLVWIGMADHQQVVPLASCGRVTDYLKEIEVEVSGELGQGPTGTCIRENRTVINDDFATNRATSPWRESALRRGFRSSAAFPLRRQGKAVGSFTLYAFEPTAFDAEQIGLLESLSADISYALDALEQERLRVRTEEELIRAKEEWERTFAGVPDMIAIIDNRYRILRANPAMARRLGVSPEKCIGLPCYEVVHGLAEPRAACPHTRTLEDGLPHIEEVHEGRLGGDFEVTTTPVYDDLGEMVGSVHVAHDITERKRAEDERELSVQFLRTINETAAKEGLIHGALAFFQKESGCEAVGIRLKEGDDYPYYETRGFPEEFVLAETNLCTRDEEGRPIHDSAGCPIMECMCGNVIQGRFDPSKPFFTERGSFWTNCTTGLLATSTEEDRQAGPGNRCNGEGYESVALIALRVGNESLGLLQLNDPLSGCFTPEGIALYERLAGYLSVALAKVEAEEALKKAHDELELRVAERTEDLQKAYDKLVEQTKERETLETQLRQAQKMEALGTLTGGIAHDFNNILAAVIGFTEVVKDRVAKESRERRHLDRVLEAGLRGRELIKRMLAFSRKTEQEKRPLRLSSVVQETIRFLRSSTPATISIRFRVEGKSGMVFADPIQMQQVVLNLCTNAAQAMQERGGVLDVEVSEFVMTGSNEGPEGMKPGPYVKLVVRDTGAGISPDLMDKIFDPFFTTKKVGEGTGLGLSVVHGIVYQHDGCIAVESEEGKGSTFTVYLPMVAGELSGDPMAEQAVHRGTERILFVDDEELLAEMGREILEDLGYQVTVRTSSMEALELFRSDPGRFDLIITDFTMPEITGVELAGEMLGIRADIPIIMCTGFSHLVDADGAKAAGIKAFTMKPLTKREIARTIRQVLGKLGQE